MLRTGEGFVQGNTKALVVGTTTDYIEWIRKSIPERALFLTDPAVRRRSEEPNPSPGEEILCDLSDYDRVLDTLPRYLSSKGLCPGDVACFDCESMELAALLARKFSLPYPSVQSVNSCRNKFLSKTLWERHKLLCPSARVIGSAADAVHLFLSVVDKKAPDLVITDAGTNTVGWERFETDYFPVLNLSRPSLEERPCHILGSLCTPHDVWGYMYFGHSIEPGDILMIPTQGAYTYSLRQHFIKPLPSVHTI